GGADLADRLPLGNDELRAHAQNFTRDRFSQDPQLPREGIRRLYERWVRNSTTGRSHVLHVGRNIVTFSMARDLVRIDLLSVLEKRQGIGSRLVASLMDHARTIEARGISVVTECENEPSWGLFMRAGFRVERFHSVFHFVAAK